MRKQQEPASRSQIDSCITDLKSILAHKNRQRKPQRKAEQAVNNKAASTMSCAITAKQQALLSSTQMSATKA